MSPPGRRHHGCRPLAGKCCDHGAIERSEPQEEAEREPSEHSPPRRFDAWRRRSAIGAIATGVAFGLKEIFQPTTPEAVITTPAPGDPPGAGERLRVILDPDDPTKSVAIVPNELGGEPRPLR
jgi:hypothetical protein